ncbi:MAG: hypothetical protein IJE59_00105 [Clostridia bacterium]|nr:hypothetical protein [Clostridia bacterium]
MSSAVKIVANICVAIMITISVAITKETTPLLVGLVAIWIINDSKTK